MASKREYKNALLILFVETNLLALTSIIFYFAIGVFEALFIACFAAFAFGAFLSLVGVKKDLNFEEDKPRKT